MDKIKLNIKAIRSTGLVNGKEITRVVDVKDDEGVYSLAMLVYHSDFICGL